MTRTPYRLSLAGGGSDLPAHADRHGGAVVSLALSQYVYATLSPRLLPGFRIAHDCVDLAASAGAITHPIVRTAFSRLEVTGPLDLTLSGAAPAGSGLGSSSAVAVGLLHAVAAMRGETCELAALAARACTLELDWMGRTMGRQDAYGCAIGGVKLLRFGPGGEVNVRVLDLPAATLDALTSCALLAYLGTRTDAEALLSRQNSAAPDRVDILTSMAQQAEDLGRSLESGASAALIGRQLDAGWALKRRLAPGVTTPQIDALYERAREAGAWGGRLTGAGGSGFLFLMAPPERHSAIAAALGDPLRLPFGICDEGARVVFQDRRAFEEARR
ncbi:hypothetical protein L2D01_00170 [Hyphomonadaceae bacterium ML37]|nr:hypothetical protein L2D01_00170 [Hyphomonadaceae bacterium ML37]